jgi:hypothetical protein
MAHCTSTDGSTEKPQSAPCLQHPVGIDLELLDLPVLEDARLAVALV